MKRDATSSVNKKTILSRSIQLDVVESWLAKNAKALNKSLDETKSFTCWRQFG